MSGTARSVLQPTAVLSGPLPTPSATPAVPRFGATSTAIGAAAPAGTASPTRAPQTLPTFAPTAAARIAPPPTAVASATRPSAPAAAPTGSVRYRAEVTRVAASARVLLATIEGEGEREISLAPGATLRRADGSATTLADLRAGDRVELIARRGADGALVAETVTLLAR